MEAETALRTDKFTVPQDRDAIWAAMQAYNGGVFRFEALKLLGWLASPQCHQVVQEVLSAARAETSGPRGAVVSLVRPTYESFQQAYFDYANDFLKKNNGRKPTRDHDGARWLEDCRKKGQKVSWKWLKIAHPAWRAALSKTP